MNRQIRQLAAGLMVCYVVLFVALNYWQVGREQELNARFDNTRAIRRQFEQPRGPIVTIDGVVTAESTANPEGSEFAYQRQYPTGDLFAPLGPLSHEEGVEVFAAQANALAEAGADVLWIETISSFEELNAACEAALATGLPVTGTLSFDTAGHTMMGISPKALGEWWINT